MRRSTCATLPLANQGYRTPRVAIQYGRSNGCSRRHVRPYPCGPMKGCTAQPVAQTAGTSPLAVSPPPASQPDHARTFSARSSLLRWFLCILRGLRGRGAGGLSTSQAGSQPLYFPVSDQQSRTERTARLAGSDRKGSREPIAGHRHDTSQRQGALDEPIKR